MLHWNGLPSFKTAALRRLDLTHNGMQAGFQKTRKIQAALSHNDVLNQSFRVLVKLGLDRKREYGDRAKTAAFLTKDKSIVQAYILDVVALLYTWSGLNGP